MIDAAAFFHLNVRVAYQTMTREKYKIKTVLLNGGLDSSGARYINLGSRQHFIDDFVLKRKIYAY